MIDKLAGKRDYTQYVDYKGETYGVELILCGQKVDVSGLEFMGAYKVSTGRCVRSGSKKESELAELGFLKAQFAF